jgi:hypothetical protein
MSLFSAVFGCWNDSCRDFRESSDERKWDSREVAYTNGIVPNAEIVAATGTMFEGLGAGVGSALKGYAATQGGATSPIGQFKPFLSKDLPPTLPENSDSSFNFEQMGTPMIMGVALLLLFLGSGKKMKL